MLTDINGEIYLKRSGSTLVLVQLIINLADDVEMTVKALLYGSGGSHRKRFKRVNTAIEFGGIKEAWS